MVLENELGNVVVNALSLLSHLVVEILSIERLLELDAVGNVETLDNVLLHFCRRSGGQRHDWDARK